MNPDLWFPPDQRFPPDKECLPTSGSTDQRPPEYRQPASSRTEIIRAAGVDPAAVDATGLPVEEISCGAAFSFVPVRTRAAVDAAEPALAGHPRGSRHGRPSRIHMRITDDANGVITRVQVGGKAVRVGDGTLDL